MKIYYIYNQYIAMMGRVGYYILLRERRSRLGVFLYK